jgi:hypothetical protein
MQLRRRDSMRVVEGIARMFTRVNDSKPPSNEGPNNRRLTLAYLRTELRDG